MTIYRIMITNHIGYPFYKWENPNKPNHMVDVVKFTLYPFSVEEVEKKSFELECGYIAAMSISALSNNMQVRSIQKKTRGLSDSVSENPDQDIIFDVDVDPYMNEINLRNRMQRVTKELIFSPIRKRLEDSKLNEEDQANLNNVFSDIDARKIIHEKMYEIGKLLQETLESDVGEGKKLYEFGIFGVGLLSSSYNILFYKGVKTILNKTDEEIDFPGGFPDNESELDEILLNAQLPFTIDGGDSKFVYPQESNLNFILHNLDIGPTVLGVREPFHLIICVKAGFPSKAAIDNLVRSMMTLLID